MVYNVCCCNFAGIAQLVEQRIRNAQVACSSHVSSSRNAAVAVQNALGFPGAFCVYIFPSQYFIHSPIVAIMLRMSEKKNDKHQLYLSILAFVFIIDTENHLIDNTY